MREKSLNKFIIFIFLYIIIVFPLALFTDELFPFSRFPMYASNTLSPCGYQIHIYKNDQAVILDTSKAASLFLKYSRDVIVKKSNSEGQMCQFIRGVFWPKKIPHQSFYITKYCADINNLPSLIFDEGVVLSCQ